MDILTLQLSLEELQICHLAKHHQTSVMKDCTDPQLQGLHNNETLNQALFDLQGDHVISSDRSVIAFHSSSRKTFNQDITENKPTVEGHITGSLCTLAKDREDSRNCDFCLETSIPPDASASLSSSTPVTMEQNSSEEELSRIDWTIQQITPPRSNSCDDEISEFVDNLRPSSTDCCCPAPMMTSEAEPKKLPGSRFSDASLKRKAFLTSSSCDSSTVILRPNLDFEKMRKTSYLQRHGNNDIKKPRMVRIRGFKDPINCVRSLQKKFYPSVTAFCSLSQKVGVKRFLSA